MLNATMKYTHLMSLAHIKRRVSAMSDLTLAGIVFVVAFAIGRFCVKS
jgi:hypothetical protein